MNTHDINIELPPLPEWSKMDDLNGLVPSEIRQRLIEYATAAVEADRQARGEPVAEITVNKDRSQTWVALKTQWLPEGKHLLYTTPQPQNPEGYKLVPNGECQRLNQAA